LELCFKGTLNKLPEERIEEAKEILGEILYKRLMETPNLS
jgi:hypothetical protein